MKYKNRILSTKIAQLARHFPVVVVTGARQVGKSTLLRHTFPDLKSIVFDPVLDINNARQEPEIFLDNHPSPVILDEIQYAPELVGSIKRRVDRQREPGMYILTGSQQWSVMKSISDSLAGRVVIVDLHGFSLSEINETIPKTNWLERYLADSKGFISEHHDAFPLNRTVNEQIWRGFLPDSDSYPLEYIPDYLGSYFQTYIERDIRSSGDVNDWQQFGRFVQLAAALTGQEINTSQLGRDIGVTPQTAKRWLATLSSTFQWYQVPPYHGNVVKRISKKHKGYLLDTGLACYLQRISSPDTLSGHPLTGSLFESAVVGELLKLMAVIPFPARMYHWRSHGGAEVDIILERDGILFPLEIKHTSQPARKHTTGINQFRETYPAEKIAPGLVICTVNSSRQLSETDYAIPWNTR